MELIVFVLYDLILAHFDGNCVQFFRNCCEIASDVGSCALAIFFSRSVCLRFVLPSVYMSLIKFGVLITLSLLKSNLLSMYALDK